MYLKMSDLYDSTWGATDVVRARSTMFSDSTEKGEQEIN